MHFLKNASHYHRRGIIHARVRFVAETQWFFKYLSMHGYSQQIYLGILNSHRSGIIMQYKYFDMHFIFFVQMEHDNQTRRSLNDGWI